MGVGASVLLMGIGAILLFALDVQSPGWMDLHSAGWILIAVGVLGLLMSIVFLRRRTVVEERPTGVTDERPL